MRPIDRHPRHHVHNPTPAPSVEEVSAAVSLLHEQWLSVYQPLYAAGLTTPGTRGGPFRVARSVDAGACIEVTPCYDGYKEYQFRVRTPEEIAGVVAKCELVIAAMEADRERVHPQACCPLASIRGCVCVVSFDCTLHGPHCYGSHD